MATETGYRRAVRRVTGICESGLNARQLRLAILDELRHAVPFDAYAWLLTDPQTWIGASPLADVPCLPELPTLIRLKYGTEVNRWTDLAEPGVALLQQATGNSPGRSLLWRELLSRYGVTDVASAVFTDRFGCWGFLDLWRTADAGAFTPRDAAFVAHLVKPVTTALRRAQAATFMVRAPAQPEHRGPVVLLLSAALDVLAQTTETQEYLRLLVPPEGDRPPIPAGAYNVAAQLLAQEAGVDHRPASARVHLDHGLWLTLRAARLGGDPAQPSAERDIAVTIETTTPADRGDLFARAHALTARETELVGRTVEGGDTRAIARELHLSEHTVQDHLKSIFAKTGLRSRQALLSQVAGT